MRISGGVGKVDRALGFRPGALDVGADLIPSDERHCQGALLRRRQVIGRPECTANPLGRRRTLTEHDRGPAEGTGDPEAQQRVVLGRPGQPGVDVRPLLRRDAEMDDLTGSLLLGDCAIGGLTEPAGVGGPCERRVTGIGEPRQGERPDAVQQSVADRAGGVDFDGDQ